MGIGGCLEVPHGARHNPFTHFVVVVEGYHYGIGLEEAGKSSPGRDSIQSGRWPFAPELEIFSAGLSATGDMISQGDILTGSE